MNGTTYEMWLPFKVSVALFFASLFGKQTHLVIVHQDETNDDYYYVNGKYICHTLARG